MDQLRFAKKTIRIIGAWSFLTLGSLFSLAAFGNFTGSWVLVALLQVFLLGPYVVLGLFWLINEANGFKRFKQVYSVED